MLALLSAGTARAHEAGLSRGEYRVHGRQVDAELMFARRELAGLVPGADADRDGDLGEFELLAVQDALRGQLAAGLQLAAGAEACAGEVTRVGFVEEDGLAMTASFTCPPAQAGPLDAVTLRLPLLGRLGRGHRHLAQLEFLAITGPEGHVLRDSSGPLDFVAHARRSALTIRRPDGPRPAPGAPTAPLSDVRTSAPTGAHGFRRWPLLLGLTLAGVAVLAWRRRRP